MLKWFATISLLVAGCGSDCDKLKKKLCSGQDEATCKAMKAWFDSELTGPDGKALDKDAAELGCKMILDDSEALKAYLNQAKEKAGKSKD